MQERFDSTLARLWADGTGGRVLLAVSGGIDSMTMADLFLHSALRPSLAVAHFNFHLRGADSDGDEALVRDWCEKHRVPFFRQEADTLVYAREHGLSIEMTDGRNGYLVAENAASLAVRLAALCREHGFTHLAVAHNLDDNAETLLLHLLRGTGLRGLCGIRDNVPLPGAEGVRLIRPLLGFSRKEIEAYAVREGVSFRIDATNADVAYARNRIRNRVFPELAAINPSFLQTFGREMRQFREAEQLLDAVFEAGRGEISRVQDGVLYLDIPALQQKAQRGWWLYKLLEGCGFNADQLAQIEAALDAQSGREFLSLTHRLVKDRRELRVYPLSQDNLTARLDVRTFSVTPGFDPKQKPDDVLFVDADKVRLPLAARPPKEGDRFRPFGMHSGSKLLSDFFTDLKLDVAQKEREVVVTTRNENGDEVIVAILGRRIDDRFKITPQTRTVAAISRI